jgi:hypothetical protein
VPLVNLGTSDGKIPGRVTRRPGSIPLLDGRFGCEDGAAVVGNHEVAVEDRGAARAGPHVDPEVVAHKGSTDTFNSPVGRPKAASTRARIASSGHPSPISAGCFCASSMTSASISDFGSADIVTSLGTGRFKGYGGPPNHLAGAARAVRAAQPAGGRGRGTGRHAGDRRGRPLGSRCATRGRTTCRSN